MILCLTLIEHPCWKLSKTETERLTRQYIILGHCQFQCPKLGNSSGAVFVATLDNTIFISVQRFYDCSEHFQLAIIKPTFILSFEFVTAKLQLGSPTSCVVSTIGDKFQEHGLNQLIIIKQPCCQSLIISMWLGYLCAQGEEKGNMYAFSTRQSHS